MAIYATDRDFQVPVFSSSEEVKEVISNKLMMIPIVDFVAGKIPIMGLQILFNEHKLSKQKSKANDKANRKQSQSPTKNII